MLKLHLDNGEAYPCFFTSSQVYGQVSPVTGTRVEVCARLVSADNSVSIVQSEACILTIHDHQVPYMAAIIWTPGTLINPAVVDSLMSSAPNPGDSERYFQCADRMMAVITGGGGETIYRDNKVISLNI